MGFCQDVTKHLHSAEHIPPLKNGRCEVPTFPTSDSEPTTHSFADIFNMYCKVLSRFPTPRLIISTSSLATCHTIHCCRLELQYVQHPSLTVVTRFANSSSNCRQVEAKLAAYSLLASCLLHTAYLHRAVGTHRNTRWPGVRGRAKTYASKLVPVGDRSFLPEASSFVY